MNPPKSLPCTNSKCSLKAGQPTWRGVSYHYTCPDGHESILSSGRAPEHRGSTQLASPGAPDRPVMRDEPVRGVMVPSEPRDLFTFLEPDDLQRGTGRAAPD